MALRPLGNDDGTMRQQSCPSSTDPQRVFSALSFAGERWWTPVSRLHAKIQRYARLIVWASHDPGTGLQYGRFAHRTTEPGTGMDAAPPPYSDMPAPPSGSPIVAERRSELLLDGLKTAIAASGEHRLFRFGRLAGLFPSRAGLSSEAAGMAVRMGLLETVRTETRGKLVVEWVQATAKAVTYVHEHDSPKSVLRELKDVLQATRDGVPQWMKDAKAEIADISYRFDARAAALLKRLDQVAERVDSALRRAETKAPGVAEPVGRVVPWAVDALEYLDRRAASGATGDCPLPELFHAVRLNLPELPLPAFHDGVKRLHDVRAVRLAPSPMMVEPEYAVVTEGRLMYVVGR